MICDYDGTNLRFYEFRGTAAKMGAAHGEHLGGDIRAAIKTYADYFDVTEAQLDTCEEHIQWRQEQIELHARRFPHLIEETHAIAKASGISSERLFDLTFNGFGAFRKRSRPGQCSIIAITTAEGQPALLSVLDDSPVGWPAIGRFVSSDPQRHAFLTTIWLGTAGAGRGMNDAGLWLGTASCGVGPAPGGPLEHHKPYALGYLFRAILETCTTVEHVRDFCRENPFCCNLIVGDAGGGILALHQTLSGSYDVTGDGSASMTNAITDDELIYDMTRAGLRCQESLDTSRPRNGYLRDFIRQYNGRCTFEELAEELTRRDTENPWSINHANTVYITLAQPHKAPRSMWVCRPCDGDHPDTFVRLEV